MVSLNGQYVVYTVSLSVIVVNPVVTGLAEHLLSEHEVTVITVCDLWVSVTIVSSDTGAFDEAGAGVVDEVGATGSVVSLVKGQKVVYSVTLSLTVVVTTVTPVVTGTLEHLLSAQEVIVTTVVEACVSVRIVFAVVVGAVVGAVDALVDVAAGAALLVSDSGQKVVTTVKMPFSVVV